MQDRPRLSRATLIDLSIANFGTALGFALQQGNMARIFQTLGADLDALPLLMIAGPVTGLVVQPIVGHYSDRTWCRLGRRRPYFLAGVLGAAFALVGLGHATSLAAAVVYYWLLDAALNVAIEPFRALVADLAPAVQRPRALAVNAALGCLGAVCGFVLPFLLARQAAASGPGVLPASIRDAVDLAAVVMVAAVGWTVWRVREYPGPPPRDSVMPEESGSASAPMAASRPAGDRAGAGWLGAGLLGGGAIVATRAAPQLYVLAGGLIAFGALRLLQTRVRLPGPVGAILSAMTDMPGVLRRLALVQLLTWFALYIMWPFMTPVITSHVFGSSVPGTAAYERGADWVGVLYAAFNIVAFGFGLTLLPWLIRRLGIAASHALCLTAGSAGFLALLVLRDPWSLFLPFAVLGIAWASLLTVPYVILADVLGGRRLGTYIGIFNYFVVLPQIVVATMMGPALHAWFPHDPVWTMAFAAAAMAAAALCMTRIEPAAHPA